MQDILFVHLPCTTKYQTLCSYNIMLQQKLCVQNMNSLRSKSHINASQNQMFSRSPLSSILNAMIPLCEPASAQKTVLEHNVWYLVVQGDIASSRKNALVQKNFFECTMHPIALSTH